LVVRSSDEHPAKHRTAMAHKGDSRAVPQSIEVIRTERRKGSIFQSLPNGAGPALDGQQIKLK
jgi:hypothetical protein